MYLSSLLNSACTGNCARVAALQTLLVAGLYLATIFWLPRFFIADESVFTKSEFQQTYPEWRWITWLYPYYLGWFS